MASGDQEGTEMDTKKLVAGVALAGTLVLGTTGVAYAAGSSGSSGSGSASTTTPAKGHPLIRRAIRRGALKEVLTLTNTTAAQLRDALKGGQTIADYAAAHGSSGQAVIDALVTKGDAAIQKALGNGKITQDQANTLTSKLPGAATKFVNRTWGQKAATTPSQPTT
jgi:hypothetical protein